MFILHHHSPATHLEWDVQKAVPENGWPTSHENQTVKPAKALGTMGFTPVRKLGQSGRAAWGCRVGQKLDCNAVTDILEATGLLDQRAVQTNKIDSAV